MPPFVHCTLPLQAYCIREVNTEKCKLVCNLFFFTSHPREHLSLLISVDLQSGLQLFRLSVIP